MKKLILSFVFVLALFAAKAQSADELFANKEYSKAVDAYTVVLKNDSTDVKALRRLAFCYSNLVNTDALVELYYKKALYHAPNDMAANFYLGLYYKERISKVKAVFKQDLTSKAKKYFKAAANNGSEDAKQELLSL